MRGFYFPAENKLKNSKIMSRLSEKSVYDLELYNGIDITAKLEIKENKGYLTYYQEDREITELTHFESVAGWLTDHYIKTAEIICEKQGCTLWSY